MVQKKHFVGWQDYYYLAKQVPSDDMFYTMLAYKNGFRYKMTKTDFEKDSPIYNEVQPYSVRGMVAKSYEQIARAFNWK